MASLWVSLMILSVVLATFHYSQAQFTTNTLLLESTSRNNPFSEEELACFRPGKYQVTDPIHVSAQHLRFVSPKEAGLYPVLFFIHGYQIPYDEYSNLYQHIASHGYIVVAPQLFTSLFDLFNQTPEIELAASVLEWIPSNLQEVLNEKVGEMVKANIEKVAISGHSRGGKSAFALALGIPQTIKLSTKISALIGVDPVAGLSYQWRTKPYVLTKQENSFNLSSIPVTVIGTGLGSRRKFGLFPPCAPLGVSHQEFYDECKEGSHFVIEKYGHMQMLNNDWIADTLSRTCASGNGPKSTMIRTLGGIMVAFLDAYFKLDKEDYSALLSNSFVAPTIITVDNKPTYAQV